jgi:hypothetical protein
VLQALELQAGFTDSSNGQELAVSQQQWDEFLRAFRDRLKLLRLIANVSMLGLSNMLRWFVQLAIWEACMCFAGCTWQGLHSGAAV